MKLTGASRRISAKDIGDFVAPVASYYKVLDAFVNNKRALNNRDVAKIVEMPQRTVRAQIATLKDNGLIKTTTCRCGNFPKYYLAKYKIKDPKRNIKRMALQDTTKYNSEVVLNAFKKHRNGLTNSDIVEMTGIRDRRVREETKLLKLKGMLTVKMCDCTHTVPFYYPTEILG